jgi:hypothetical protein
VSALYFCSSFEDADPGPFGGGGLGVLVGLGRMPRCCDS